MTTSRTPAERALLVVPVIDCEPPPVGIAACPPPMPKALRRRTTRPSPSPSGGRYPQRPAPISLVREAAPPRAAVVFADAALRRVLEVIDRRRSVAQLRHVVAPALIEDVLALSRSAYPSAATLRRIRLRVVDEHARAAEVFGTYSRGGRVLAIAARVALDGDRWRIVALQIG